MNAKQIADAKQQLCRMFYSENIPFHLIESPFFRDFISTLRPAFINHLPSRYEISNPLLNTSYEEMKKKVSSFMKNVEKICLVTDGWSNIRGDSIINFVFTTPRPIFHKSINATRDSHTGKFIGEELCKVISEIGPDRFAAIVTDNAANMKSAWKFVQGEYSHIFCVGCIAHGVHLLSKDIITKIPSIKNLCSKCEKIVNFFWNHHMQKYELEAEQQRQKIDIP